MASPQGPANGQGIGKIPAPRNGAGPLLALNTGYALQVVFRLFLPFASTRKEHSHDHPVAYAPRPEGEAALEKGIEVGHPPQ